MTSPPPGHHSPRPDTRPFRPGPPGPAASIDPHAPAAIAYTSGTTGRPKGAVHSQHNLLWPGISSRRSYPAVPDERHGAALALTILNKIGRAHV